MTWWPPSAKPSACTKRPPANTAIVVVPAPISTTRGAEIGLVVGERRQAGDIGARHHGLDVEMAALDRQHQVARGGDIGGRDMHVDAEAARRACRADRGCRARRRANSRSAASAARARPSRTECRLPAASTRAMSAVGHGRAAAHRSRRRTARSPRPAGRDRQHDARTRAARRPSARRGRPRGGRPLRPPRDRPRCRPSCRARRVWPKPITSMAWLRRRKHLAAARCGCSRAIRQAILLVPMSSAATSAVRLRRDRLHLRRQAVIAGSSCVAPLRLRLLVLERLVARLRGGIATAAPSRGRAGADRSSMMSRDEELLVAVERRPARSSAASTSASGSRTSMPFLSRRFQRRSRDQDRRRAR